MTAEPAPRSVITGRRVAIVLLSIAMTITIVAILLLINWWATLPIVP
ncbi:hypothetical protein [Solihabitans fulvus]|nr:hypothetical protein [Solihabitans fulvus]